MLILRPSLFLRPFVRDAPFVSGRTLSVSLPGVRVVPAELDPLVDRLALQGLNHGPFHQALTHFGYGVASNGHRLNRDQAERLGETFDGLPRAEQLGVMSAGLAVAAQTIEESDNDRFQNQVLGIWRGEIAGLKLCFGGLGEMSPHQIQAELDFLRAQEVPCEANPLGLWKLPFAFFAREWGHHLFGRAFPINDEIKVDTLLRAADFLGWGGAYYLAGEVALSAATHAIRLGLPEEIIDKAWRKSGMYFMYSGRLAHAGYVCFNAGWCGLSLGPLRDAKGPRGEPLVPLEVFSAIVRLVLTGENGNESKAFVLSLLQQRVGQDLWEKGQERMALVHFVDGAGNAAKAGMDETAFRILKDDVWRIAGVARED